MGRPEPGPRSWVEDVFYVLARIVGAVNRSNARFLQRATALMGRYAVRSLSRRKWHGVMLAASIMLALTSFLMFSAYLNATRTRMEGEVVPLELGDRIDAAAIASYDGQASFPANTASNPSLLARGEPEQGLLISLYTSFGSSRFWGFSGEGLAASAVALSEGRFPTEPGEIAVPQEWAAGLGALPGSECELRYLDPTTNRWRDTAGIVVGVMQPGPYIARYPVTTYDTLALLRGTTGPNVVLMHWASDTSPRTGAAALASILDPAQLLTPSTPTRRADDLVGGLFSPMRIVMVIIFAFSALGVLNVMLLSFLQRRRQFGILKATGAEDRELQVLLLLEGFLMALGGIVAGVGAAALSVSLLNRLTTDVYILDPVALTVGVALAAAVFYAGAWLPVSMLKQATVDELLRNRRF